jgi:purine-binding chemotaxis protein CheW
MERVSAEASATGRCLLVQAGDRVCALPLARVRRVVRALPFTPLPGSAPELLGLAEFGGEPLPVLDLVLLIGAAPGAAAALPVTVVVVAGREGETEVAGLAADAALDVAEVPTPTTGRGHALVLETLVDERPVSVLDLAAIGQAT